MNVYILEYLFCLSHTWRNMARNNLQQQNSITVQYSFSEGYSKWSFIVQMEYRLFFDAS